MIWMKRMHLVNWMYYSIETVEWDKSNLITGITGSGKTSLLDALQVVLLGDTNWSFNRSAGGGAKGSGKRSLASYLRGAIQTGGYKRPDKAFSSYLVTDFLDDVNHEEFCFGLVFDIAEDDAIDKDYFTIDSAFQLKWAVEERGRSKVARDRSSFKQLFKGQPFRLKLFNFREYRDELIQRLGIYSDRFFRVFRTAVAYTPMDRVEEFIITNICPELGSIDLDKMRSSIHEYNHMQRDMDDFTSRKKYLDELFKIHKEYETMLARLRSQEYYLARAAVDIPLEERDAARQAAEQFQAERNQCETDLNSIKEKINLANSRLEELSVQIATEPAEIRRKKLDEQREDLEKQKNDITVHRDRYYNQLRQFAAAWRKTLKDAAQSPAGEFLGAATLADLYEALEEFWALDVSEFSKISLDILKGMNQRLELLKDKEHEFRLDWTRQQEQREQEEEDCTSLLEDLRKGKKAYPQELIQLRDALRRDLSAAAGQPVQVDIFGDLVDITDPAWTNAVEGYLHRQRFHLLADPAWYRQAVSFFRSYTQQNRIYEYSLVHTESLLEEEPPKVLDNSLAKLIATDHPAARQYADYLLGRVECVEDIASVGGRRTAVTKDGMLYHSYTVSAMNPKNWKMHFIGKDSISQQIEETERRLAGIQEELRRLKKLLVSLEGIRAEKPRSEEFLDGLQKAAEGSARLPSLEEEIESVWIELSKIDFSYVDKLKAQQEEVRNKQNELQKSRDTLSTSLGSLQNSIQLQEALAASKQEEWKQAQQQFNAKYPPGCEANEIYGPRYEKELAGKGSAKRLRQDFEPAFQGTKSRLEGVEVSFRRVAEKHNQEHSSSAFSTSIGDSEWLEAYQRVQNTDVEQFSAKVEKARRQAEEIFCNDFINRLKSDIDTVQREIRGLNQALAMYTFGQTRYKFQCSPTSNPEMRRYYDMITSQRLDGVSIFDMTGPTMEEAEYQALVKNLFDLLASDGTLEARKEAEKNLEKYTSIETYLSFDLMEVTPDGREVSLSRTIGRRSGGERQTPFYIAILASLMYTYRVNSNANSLRLVVFDEAFDKIDTSRIEECISMLNEIGFQSVIAAPDNKAAYIAPLVERTWLVLKTDNKTSQLYPYEKELKVLSGVL